MRYGFVGLGNLGRHLAMSLVRAGFPLTVADLDRANAADLLAAGAAWADTPEAVARASDAVVTCLPSPAVSQKVLDSILAGLPPGGTWIEMSTNGEAEVLRMAAQCAERGVRMLECPVTGGVHLAASGRITVIVGGDAGLFALHEPALKAMGERIFHAGPLGKAAVIKVITNMLAFIHLLADGEALMLAARGGLDLRTAWEVIRASSGNSFVHETEGQLILNGSYDVAFSMDLALKDLGFALGFGQRFGVPLDLASVAMQTFLRGKAVYGGEANSTQIVKLLEDALGTPLRAEGFPARLTED